MHDLAGEVVQNDAEISERMSGNLCHCSASPNIIDAIREVADKGGRRAEVSSSARAAAI